MALYIVQIETKGDHSNLVAQMLREQADKLSTRIPECTSIKVEGYQSKQQSKSSSFKVIQ